MKTATLFCTLAAALMTFAAVGEEPFGMTASTTVKARGNINNVKNGWTQRWLTKAKQTAELKNDIQILFVGDSITNGAELVTNSNQIFVSDRDYVLSDEIVSCSPGRQGLGFNNNRTDFSIHSLESIVRELEGPFFIVFTINRFCHISFDIG